MAPIVKVAVIQLYPKVCACYPTLPHPRLHFTFDHVPAIMHNALYGHCG